MDQQSQQPPQEQQEQNEEQPTFTTTQLITGIVTVSVIGGLAYWYFSKPAQPQTVSVSSAM